VNTTVAAGIARVAPHVHLVLTLGAYPQIAASIVERIAVDVVNQHPRRRIHDVNVYPNESPSLRLGTLNALSPCGIHAAAGCRYAPTKLG
jgi:hypothetical protein